jgi:sigma-B regulation protein RsbU (phosphoserine phosphatase)
MTPDAARIRSLPDPVQQTLRDFEQALGLRFRLLRGEGPLEPEVLYHSASPVVEGGCSSADPAAPLVRGVVESRDFGPLVVEILGVPPGRQEPVAGLVTNFLDRAFDFSREVRFFTYELSERYEEINLLYSISETLGSLLRLDDAARVILGEVCDVLGARRGSLWVFDAERGLLELVAAVGEEGLNGPLPVEDSEAVTARVFREGRPFIVGLPTISQDGRPTARDPADTLLSVPIRYSPVGGEPRTVGVVNLIGRRRGGRFTASDQKLLAAIASQVGAALENRRLMRESLTQERTAREMELAHNLQMKLLPVAEHFEGAEVAARVQPAEKVGGDFFHLLHLSEGRIGVMIGDVSTHGFPAALIMALSMSAASIYALEEGRPAGVLRRLDDALRDELETTEMYLSLFYGVLDPVRRELVYSNAGHPHAFLIQPDGGYRRLGATDPPVGIAGPGSYLERALPWSPGKDLLLLFTDGISDTLAEGERRSGEMLVLETAIAGRFDHPREIVDELFRRAEQAVPTMPADDRTVLVMKA